jgi:hypothetical protein
VRSLWSAPQQVNLNNLLSYSMQANQKLRYQLRLWLTLLNLSWLLHQVLL